MKKVYPNIVYEVVVGQLTQHANKEECEKYKFKDLGYLFLYYGKTESGEKNMHGFITPEDLKLKLGEKQWKKFCEGKRVFVLKKAKTPIGVGTKIGIETDFNDYDREGLSIVIKVGESWGK